MKKTKVAIHQINFAPWFPFFYKMAMADIFVLHTHVLFSKNGYQNRFRYKGKWITKPVRQGTEALHIKDYVGLDTDRSKPYWTLTGGSVRRVNELWIRAIKETLNIQTRLTMPRPVSGEAFLPPSRKIDKTSYLIELVKDNGGNVYITNPDAKDKYLDEERMRAAGIEIEYCDVPKRLQKSTFEMFEEFGIEGTMKQLPGGKSVNAYIG